MDNKLENKGSGGQSCLNSVGTSMETYFFNLDKFQKAEAFLTVLLWYRVNS